MKELTRLIAVFLMTFNLVACSVDAQRFQNFVGVISHSQVPQETIVVAISAFDAIKITADNYIRLRRCPVNTPICRDPTYTEPLAAAMDSGTKARNDLKAFLRSHPNGELGPQGVYDALVTATNTVTNITAAYRAAINK